MSGPPMTLFRTPFLPPLPSLLTNEESDVRQDAMAPGARGEFPGPPNSVRQAALRQNISVEEINILTTPDLGFNCGRPSSLGRDTTRCH